MPSLASGNRTHAVQSAIVILLLLPGLLLFAFDFSQAMGLFIYGVMIGFLVALLIDVRFALLMVVAFTVATMVAYAASPSPPLAAIVMTVSVLLYGLTAHRGVAGFIVMAPTSIAFTLAQPPTVLPDSSVLANVLVLGLVAAVAGAWGLAAGTVLGKRIPKPPLTDVSWRATWIFAATLAVVCGIAIGVVRVVDVRQDGAWILLTLLIVVQPAMQKTWIKVRDRLIGTFAGFVVALLVSVPLNGHPVTLTIAAFILLAIAVFVLLMHQPYWRYVMFLTPGVVLIVGAESNVAVTDINRVWSTIIGAAIAVGLLLVLRAVGLHDADERTVTTGEVH